MTRSLRNQHLHFDGTSGAAGDMIVAALLDLGVPAAVVTEALDRVGVGGDRLTVRRVVKRGISATDVTVRSAPGEGRGWDLGAGEPKRTDPDPSGHGHAAPSTPGHDHLAPPTPGPDHAPGPRAQHTAGPGAQHTAGRRAQHTAYRDIVTTLETAGLEPEVARRSLAIFERLARAEAAIHDTPVDRVAFHEVGAIDSIVDVVGAAAALAHLSPARVTASPVAVGHGTVEAAHGRLPVPAPATLEILRAAGGQMIDGGVARELCTPTGAAILAASVDHWGPPPALVPVAIGYGAGDIDLPDRANVVRALLGSVAAGAAPEAELFRVEANIDDMSPELTEHVAATLFERGALDVWWTPITMKKSRPAVLLTALAPAAAREAVVEAILRETTSIGVRFDAVRRRVLAREHETVATEYGTLPVKVARIGDEVVNVAPEYEACRQAAATHGVALKQVFAAALAAYHARRRGT